MVIFNLEISLCTSLNGQKYQRKSVNLYLKLGKIPH